MRNSLLLKAEDGVEIAADYYPAGGKRGTVLIHMMPATRKSYRAFAELLQSKHISALAIDLRGHGDSIRDLAGQPLEYQKFSDAEHQSSIHDLRAAAAFLKSKNIQEIFLVGASIGANLALQALSEDSTLRGAALLSPGYNYRGIETAPLISKLHAGQKVLFAASRDDMQSRGTSAAEMAQNLFDKTPASIDKEIKLFDAAGHGTTIFEKEPRFMEETAEWIANA